MQNFKRRIAHFFLTTERISSILNSKLTEPILLRNRFGELQRDRFSGRQQIYNSIRLRRIELDRCALWLILLVCIGNEFNG